jgi:hypothetical protein
LTRAAALCMSVGAIGVLNFGFKCRIWFILCTVHVLGLVLGRAIAQADSRQLPIAAAWVLAQVRICGIFGAKSVAGVGFLRVLRFPLPILIQPTASHSSPIVLVWYNRPKSGRRDKWTQSHPTLYVPRYEKLDVKFFVLRQIFGSFEVAGQKYICTSYSCFYLPVLDCLRYSVHRPKSEFSEIEQCLSNRPLLIETLPMVLSLFSV